MISEKIPSIKSLSLLRITGWVFALAAVLVAFVLWPKIENKDCAKKDKTAPSITNSNSRSARHPQAGRLDTIRETFTKPAPHRDARQQIMPDMTSSAIGELLSNGQLSHDETAREMANIALDPNASEAERLEAMEHGKNLGFSHLLPLSSDPNLPLPLAESYLHGLHGHDQPKEQVSGALGLLNHNDAEIRQQAQTLIGFLIGAEEDNESPDMLRKKVGAFLKQPGEGDEEVAGQ